MRKLKDPCQTCGRPLDPSWKICPFCEAEIGAAPPTPTARRSRRRRETAAAGSAGTAGVAGGEQPAAEQPSTT
jgi:hypothetical protein